MGEKTEISWCEHTFNPWIGCTKVSPACDGCYAEAMMDLRYGKVKWGGERVRTAPANWKQPIKWNKRAGIAGTRPRVFCASLADVFDNQVPPVWREDLFELIRITPNLTWLLLTKRPQNIVKMVHGSALRYLPYNAAIGTTCEDQERADRNLTELLRAAAETGPAFTFGSFEPLLRPIDISVYLRTVPSLDWVIAGGETDQGKHKARPSHPDWIRSLRDQCAAVGTPFHFKRWGEWAPCAHDGEEARSNPRSGFCHPEGKAAKWPTPEGFGEYGPGWLMTHGFAHVARVGKKTAGRLLDGIEHNGMPERA
jgi:protein gp37